MRLKADESANATSHVTIPRRYRIGERITAHGVARTKGLPTARSPIAVWVVGARRCKSGRHVSRPVFAQRARWLRKIYGGDLSNAELKKHLRALLLCLK